MALPRDDFSDVLVFSTRVAGPVVASAAFNGILELMKLGFEETQTPYTSSSQSARAWTEQWVHNQVYCPNCGSAKIETFPNNSPVADFFLRELQGRIRA
jgi:hypothetical protein